MYNQELTNSKWLKNRRSQRVDLNVPIVIYRPPNEGPQFYESTQTCVVSAHGALMALPDMVVLSSTVSEGAIQFLAFMLYTVACTPRALSSDSLRPWLK